MATSSGKLKRKSYMQEFKLRVADFHAPREQALQDEVLLIEHQDHSSLGTTRATDKSTIPLPVNPLLTGWTPVFSKKNHKMTPQVSVPKLLKTLITQRL